MEQFAELVQSVCPFLGIAFHLDSDERTLLAQDEIHFIVPLTPIEHFKTMHKGLTYQISTTWMNFRGSFILSVIT